MSFLQFNEADDSVTLIPEAEHIEPVNALREHCGNDIDHYFTDSLKYIYHVYKKNHYFASLSINERRIKTMELYLANKDWHLFEDNKFVKELAKFYISLEYTQNEWAFEKLKVDISDIQNAINEIPMIKQEVIDVEKTVQVKCPACDHEFKTKATVSSSITIDNSEERMNALENLVKVLKVKDMMAGIVDKENKQREVGSSGNSMLENKEFDRIK